MLLNLHIARNNTLLHSPSSNYPVHHLLDQPLCFEPLSYLSSSTNTSNAFVPANNPADHITFAEIPIISSNSAFAFITFPASPQMTPS